MSAPKPERERVSILRRPTIVGGAMGIAFGVLAYVLYPAPLVSKLFQRAEFLFYDIRLTGYPEPDKVSDELLVLKIDDTTVRKLETEGVPWPAPRWFYGDLVAALEVLEPKAIVFDWVFADQRDGARYGLDGDPFAVVTDENAQAGGAEFSRITGRQMNAAGNVVHGFYAMNLNGTDDEIRNSVGWNAKLVPYFDRRIPTVNSGAATVPVPRFVSPKGFRPALRYPEGSMLVGARALGLVNQQNVNDLDGITRRFEPLSDVDGRLVADLAPTALVVASLPLPRPEPPEWNTAQPPPPATWDPLPPIVRTGNEIRIGTWTVPVDAKGKALIRWRGNWDTDKHLMARTKNVLEVWQARDALAIGEKPELDPADYKDKIILIGFTGQGEGSDFVTTPFGAQPGVYRHAAILDTILTRDFPKALPSLADWAIALVLAASTGAFVLARAGAKTRFSRNVPLQVIRLSLIGFFPIFVFIVAAALAFRGPALGGSSSIALGMVPSLLSAGSTLPVVIFLGIAWAQGAERRARKMAVRALGPALVKQVEDGDGVLKMGGERRPLTLYFSDIAGFTTISETLSPEDLLNMLNEYLTRVSEILTDGHGATIDKYIGDAVMAFWGAPISQPDGPIKACMAALDVMKAIDTYSAELVAQGLSPLKTRIGINTGPAVAGGVGHIRDEENGKFSYTAMGDTVNLASRLEGANKAYGTTCMLGPGTYEAAKDAILARELDLVRVKGKTVPVRVYELMGRASDPLPQLRLVKQRYEEALAKFRKREFAQAREEFLALVTEFGDSPSKTLVASCDELLRKPPAPEWDGSNELHEK